MDDHVGTTVVSYLVWLFAGLGLLECLGLLPVAVIARQLRQYGALHAALWSGQGTPDADDDDTNANTPKVLRWYSFWSRVWLSDVDFWLHQNNVRYYSRCEEGRFQVLLRSGLSQHMVRNKYISGLAGCVVRFRRELRPLQRYRVRSRISGWDERSIFIEHQFCSEDGFVHAHGMATFKLIRKVCEKGNEMFSLWTIFIFGYNLF